MYAILGLETKDFDAAVAKIDRNLRTMGNRFEQFGIRASAMVGAPLALGLNKSLGAFRDFQTAFAGIKKTLTVPEEDQPRVFGILERDLRNLSKRMPQSASELARIGEMAGQLGVKAGDLVGFVEVMAKIGDTTDLSSDQAAIAFARFTNIIELPRSQVQSLADSLIILGNNTATFESAILDMSTHFAAAASSAGLSGDEIFAVAAALSSMGEEAEAGSSSMTKLFGVMINGAVDGGKKLKALNQVIQGDFKKAFEEDAGATFVRFIEGLEGIKNSAKTLTPVLSDLGLSELRVSRALLKLASNSALVKETVALVNSEMKNGALMQEATKRYATLDSKLAMLGNRLNDVAISFGGRLAPQVEKAGEIVAWLAEKFDALPEGFKDFALYFSEITVAVTAGSLAFGLLAKAVGLIGITSVGSFGLLAAGLAGIIAFGPQIIEFGKMIGNQFVALGKMIANFFIGIFNTVVQWVADIGHGVTEVLNSLASSVLNLFNIKKEFSPFNYTPAKKELLDYQINLDKAFAHADKMAEGGKKNWGTLSSGVTEFNKRLAKLKQAYEKLQNDEKKLTKEQKARIKELEKIESLSKKASEYLDERLAHIRQSIQEADIQKGIEDAFKRGDAEALASWKERLAKSTREGIEQAFLEKGGQFPLTKEDSDRIGQLAGIEAGKAWDESEKKFEEKAKSGFLKDFPNYLSQTITESILNGFEGGFSSDAIKGWGKSISSVFAQGFQDTFKGLFSKDMLNAEGGLDLSKISEQGGLAIAQLGASYGINSLFQNLSDNKKDTSGGALSGGIAGASIGFMTGGPLGAVLGGAGGASLGYLAGMFGSSSNANTNQRHDTVNFIEGLLGGTSIGDIVGGNVFEGSNQGFNNPLWSTAYWQEYGQEAGSAFESLGVAFSQMAGQVGPAMEQVGVILATNLNGNLDLARLTLQSMDIDAAKLEESFMALGYAGDRSWHDVEVYMQSISALTGEGLTGFADLTGAVELLRGTMGTGKIALEGVRALLVEIGESGASSIDDARAAMIAQGIAAEDVDRILQALATRGITNFQDLGDVSDREIAGVIADMESLGFQWEDIGTNIEGAAKGIDKLSERIHNLENKEVEVKVKINYEENNKPDVLKSSSSFDFTSIAKPFSGTTSSEERSLPILSTLNSEPVSMSGITINVDARGSSEGVERKITAAILASQKQIIQGSLSAMQQMRRRGVL